MKKRLIIFLLVNILLLFLTKTEVYAEVCGLSMDWCEEEIGEPYTTCCTSSGGCPLSSVCGDLDQWDWCYANDCCAWLDPQLCDWPYGDIICYYDWRYGHTYTSCGATDTCFGTPYLYAGLCSETGCTVGGRYKVCCNADGTVDGNCNGGQFTGTCPVGTITKFCGWGGYPDCGAPDVCGGAPTPTPGEPTPTPDPGSCAEGCSWCTNPTDCTNSGCTVGDTPSGACAVEGDICCCCPETPGEGRIKVNIVDHTHDVCDPVTIEVYQEPDNSGSSACYYESIDVKINNPGGTVLPPDFVVCRAGNFKSSSASNECDWGGDDGRCRTCIWDTSNIQIAPDSDADDFIVEPYPAGYYIASVYYGGHSDPGCSDAPDSDTDDTTLVGEPCYDPWDPNEDCSEGTERVEVDISSQVDPHFNSLFGWQKLGGEPGILGWSSNCCYRSRGSRCDAWGHCGDIMPFDGNFLCDRAYEDDCMPREYTVSTRLSVPPETIDHEYLVSVMGTGIEAERTGHAGTSIGESRPSMKLISGGFATRFYYFSKTCKWQEGRYKMMAQEPWIEVYLRSVTIKKTHGTPPPQAAFDNLKLYYCAAPIAPMCIVSGSTTVSVNTTVPYCAITTDAPEGAEIWKSPTTSQDWTNVRPKGADGCSGTSFAQPGTYYVVCNAFGPSIQCSGNPWCPWEPEALPEASCDGWVDCTANDVLTVTVTIPDPWFQTKSGDVHAGGDIYSGIPSTCESDPDCEPYFSLKGDEGQSSVVSYTESADFGEGSVSEDGRWLAKSSYKGDEYGYDYFDKKIGSPQPLDGNPSVSDLNALNGFYKVDGNLTLPESVWNINSPGQKVTILVSGDLTINRRIGVGTNNNFLTFIASGDIIIQPEVKDVGVNPALEGIFIADGTTSTIGSGSEDDKFTVKGVFVGWTGVSLGRDREGDNGSDPAETFIYRPDLWANSPQELWSAKFTWQELAP